LAVVCAAQQNVFSLLNLLFKFDHQSVDLSLMRYVVIHQSGLILLKHGAESIYQHEITTATTKKLKDMSDRSLLTRLRFNQSYQLSLLLCVIFFES
jgi:hypothetical protein